MLNNVELITVPVSKRYTASRLSFAYLVKVIGTCLAIIIPYILSLSPQDYPLGIWLKRDVYREQPAVKFQYRVILVAQVKDDSNGNGTPRELYYSTVREVNEARPETFRAASVSSQEVDRNLDGLVDSLKLEIDVPLLMQEQVYGVQALVFLNYRLQKHVKVDMECLAFIDSRGRGGLPGSSYSSRGDLVLRQNLPMRVEKKFTNLYKYDNDLLRDIHTVRSVRDSNILSIMESYGARDVFAHYVERLSHWGGGYNHARDPDPGPGPDPDRDGNEVFHLEVTVDIPGLQQVIFIPTLPQVLVEAWNRYLSLLVISGYIMRRFFLFLYTNQIVRSKLC